MKKTYVSAQGKQISMDSIRMENESVIAVGNMKVNAKGEALGPGGVPEATRRKMVNDYYNLHTPVVADNPTARPRADKPVEVELPPSADPLIDEQDAVEVVKEEPKMRGSLADAVAKTAVVNQELLKTPKQAAKDQGPTRI